MSHVMKLEAECKSLVGTLFTTNDFPAGYVSTPSGHFLPLTAKEIACLDGVDGVDAADLAAS